MSRKILKWIILSESEYRRLMEYERAVKTLNDVTLTLIDMVKDLFRRL